MKAYEELLNFPFVVLDTETTGLGNTAQVCELAVVCGQTGDILLNTKVKPTVEIEERAMEVHKITPEDVKDAPAWDVLYHEVLPTIFTDRLLVAYNSDFDSRMMYQSALAHGIDDPNQGGLGFYCAMKEFANYAKVYNHLQGGNRWFKLAEAASLVGIEAKQELHSALMDSALTLGVIRRVQQLEGLL